MATSSSPTVRDRAAVPTTAASGRDERSVLGEDTLDWLMTGTRDMRYVDDVLAALCLRLRAGGLPVARGTLIFRTHNPEWLGARVQWREGMSSSDVTTFDYDAVNSPQYLNSPTRAIHDGTPEVRRRLEGAAAADDYPFYDELRAEGLTDYVAWPLGHTLGKRHVVSFASDRTGGFSDGDVATLTRLVPALSLVSEVRIKNRLARTLLETYVGTHATDEILAGATTRGSGRTVEAAVMICDLRDFTSMSEEWPRDDVIALLNDYFDAMSAPIEKHGGEILKFMGDGLLAIFPLGDPDACSNLLEAIREARDAIERINRGRTAQGRAPLSYGIGAHVGDVMYGNIGSRKRLDFTVIGPAVNVASRLERLTKELMHRVLLSGPFVRTARCRAMMQDLGTFRLRGLGRPVEVFAFLEGNRDEGDFSAAAVHPAVETSGAGSA